MAVRITDFNNEVLVGWVFVSGTGERGSIPVIPKTKKNTVLDTALLNTAL